MDNTIENGNVEPAYPITALPPKALQAVYHAVTGKTESTEKSIRKNIIIDNNAIENLYHRLKQELDIQNLICDPTVTIVVNYDEDGSQTYSSWERFQSLRQIEDKVTSSVEIKIESVLRVPGTDSDQRLIVSVGLDSALPILDAESREDSDRLDFGWIAFSRNVWKTVQIKIDYVDFVIAKNFVHLVEKWADALPKTSEDDETKKILARLPLLGQIGPQIGRIGACTFLICTALFGSKIGVSDAILAVGLAGLIWGLTEFLRKSAFSKITEAAAKAVIPSVILFNDCDVRTFERITQSKGASPLRRLISFFAWSLGSIIINILSSYIFVVWFVSDSGVN